MKRNVLVTLTMILILILAACTGGNNTGDETEPTEDPQAQVTEEETPTDDEVARPTEEPRIPVVIAIQNIPRGTVIQADRLATVLYPADVVPGGAFDSVEFVVGKIAATDIYAEEFILSRKLVESFDSLGSVGSDAAALLEPGRVAVSVPIDRITSVAYALQSGDRVDVIVSMLFVDLDQDFQTLSPNIMTPGSYFNSITSDPETNSLILDRRFTAPPDLSFQVFNPPVFYQYRAEGFESRNIVGQDAYSSTGSVSVNVTTRDDLIIPVVIEPSEQQRPRLLTARTVTDAQVLWVGEFPRDGRIFAPAPTPTPIPVEDPDEELVDADGEVITPTPIADRPTIITLAVRPQDAVILTYMAESGIPMTFALRSARTQGLPDTDPVTLAYLLATYEIVPPEALNFGLEPAIRSIRGITLENIFGGESATEAGTEGGTGDAATDGGGDTSADGGAGN